MAGKSTIETVEISAKKRGNFALLQSLNGSYVCIQKLIGKATASDIQMSKTVQKFLIQILKNQSKIRINQLSSYEFSARLKSTA